MRAIVRDVLDTHQTLDASTLSDAYDAALAHYGLSEQPPAEISNLVLDTEGNEQAEKLIIRTLLRTDPNF